MAIADVIRRFKNFEIEHEKTRLEAQAVRIKVAAGLLPADAATEAERECCRRFKRWCAELTRNDPAREVLPPDFSADVLKRLRELEEACPDGNDPPPKEMHVATYTHTAKKEGHLIRFQLKDRADRIVATGTGATVSAAQQNALESQVSRNTDGVVFKTHASLNVRVGRPAA